MHAFHYNVDSSAVAKSSSISGNSMTSTYLGGMDCVGTENTISECAQRSTQFCIKLGAGVICPVKNGNLAIDVFICNECLCSSFMT